MLKHIANKLRVFSYCAFRHYDLKGTELRYTQVT